jgi:hypothetical protein
MTFQFDVTDGEVSYNDQNIFQFSLRTAMARSVLQIIKVALFLFKPCYCSHKA